MSEPSFIRAQRDFAAHLRDPDKNAAPRDVEERRLKIYRDLFYNNVAGFLGSGFPVLHELLPEKRWHALVRAFFACHVSESPYFVDIPAEFVRFLSDECEPAEEDPPFMPALAHYEWMELVADIARDEIPQTGFNPRGDLLRGVPLLSPLVYVLHYDWPVHRISPDFRPETPEPVWLLVYRDAGDRVRFMEINAVTARLLTLLQEGDRRTGAEVLEQIAGELGAPEVERIQAFGRETLETLRERDIVLGTRMDSL